MKVISRDMFLYYTGKLPWEGGWPTKGGIGTEWLLLWKLMIDLLKNFSSLLTGANLSFILRS
jgi:hypothetical protein